MTPQPRTPSCAIHLLASPALTRPPVLQEEELQTRERALEASEREIAALKRTLEALHGEAARTADANEELRAKLEDSKQQLKGNEQMIRWLNAQVRAGRATGADQKRDCSAGWALARAAASLQVCSGFPPPPALRSSVPPSLTSL